MAVKNEEQRIMVIDDSSTVQSIIRGTLKRNGYEVDCFSSGLDALNALSRHAVPKPHLVLLDINIPDLDGYGVARLMRQKGELDDTVIVMISGRNGYFDKIRGMMVGARGYISKPFQPGDILKKIRSLLSTNE